jgi:hypothetical protein
VVNQFYVHCVDEDFGAFFLKFSSYFPYGGKLVINGHHYAQAQAARAGIGFAALDNGFAAVDDPAAVQAICDSLTEDKIEALARKWLAILPSPYSPADQAAGYRYDISVLQAEFSLTQVPDRPASGRIFFDQVIHDNLGIGRPLGPAFDSVGRSLWLLGNIICADRVEGRSPFGHGSDAMVGVAVLVQVAGQLTSGSVRLLEADNLYSALALIRQLVEVEYLCVGVRGGSG